MIQLVLLKKKKSSQCVSSTTYSKRCVPTVTDIFIVEGVKAEVIAIGAATIKMIGIFMIVE
jgi:hypothetical protein